MRDLAIRIARRLRDQRGVAMVEFAMVVPLLLVLLFGTVDMSRAFNYKNSLTQLANQGARLAAVNSSGGGNLHTYIQGQAAGGLSSRMSSYVGTSTSSGVCIAFPTNPSTSTNGKIGDPVQVKTYISYTFLRLPLGISSITKTVSGQATMRLEQTPTYTADVTGGQCP